MLFLFSSLPECFFSLQRDIAAGNIFPESERFVNSPLVPHVLLTSAGVNPELRPTPRMNGGFARRSSGATSAVQTFASLTRKPLNGNSDCSGGTEGGLTGNKAAIFLPFKRRDYLPRELSTTHCFSILSTSSFRVAPSCRHDDKNGRTMNNHEADLPLILLKLL